LISLYQNRNYEPLCSSFRIGASRNLR
jgi:hypothetical protein